MGWFNDIVGVVGSAVGSLPIPGASGIGQGLASWANKNDAKEQARAERNWQSHEAELNRQFQRDERFATQEFNIDMWNMNNEYNSPVEQLKRAQAAGINPNAVFSGGVDGGAVAKAVTSSPQMGSVAPGTNSIASSMLTSDAVVANLLAQADKTKVQADREKVGLTFDMLSAPYKLELYKKNSEYISKQIEKMTRDIQHVNFDEELQTKMYGLYANKNEAEVALMTKQLEEIGARIRNYDADTGLKEAQTGLTQSQTVGTDYENYVKKARAEVAEITGFAPDTPANLLMFSLAKEGRVAELAQVFTMDAISQNTGGFFGTVKNGLNAVIGSFLGRAGVGLGARKVGRDNMNLRNP